MEKVLVADFEKPRYGKSSFLMAITDLASSQKRVGWIFVDFAIALMCVRIGASSGPFGTTHVNPAELNWFSLSFAVAFCAFALGAGYYERFERFTLHNILGKGVLNTLLAAVTATTTTYFAFYDVFGRWTVLFAAIGAYLGLASYKILAFLLLKKFPYRFTILGSSPLSNEIKAQFKHTSRYGHFEEIEICPNVKKVSHKEYVEELRHHKVGDMILTKEVYADPELMAYAVEGLKYDLRIVDEIDFYQQLFECLPIDEVNESHLLRQGLSARRPISDAIKRTFDVVFALVGLVLSLPIIAILGFITKLTSPGPLFYNQPRMGLFSEPFLMYKLRTMHYRGVDCPNQSFTQENDPRVTKIGRIMRPLHLDELPQFLNILKGDMSLIGPRPETSDFGRRIRKSLPVYDLRYLVRPGLTGLAQINAGYMMDNIEDTKKKLSYDLYYLCKFSLFMDLRILLMTVFRLAFKAR